MNKLDKQVFFTTILGLMAFCLLDVAVLAQTCVLPPPGAIGWWPLDETGGTVVKDIAGANPGIRVNGPVSAAGNVGGSLRFNGLNQYVGAPDSDLWAFGTKDFTIELWANFDAPGGGSIGHPGDIFIGNDEGAGTLNKWFFALGGGFLNFHINGPGIGPKFFPLVPFSPALNRWYHLAITRSGNVYTIYVDGIPMGSAVNSSPVPNANAPLTIGQAEDLGFMNGLLDEVTIYSRALSQAELQAIVSAGKCKALTISTRALPAMQLRVFSSFRLETIFGQPPLTWSVVGGALPAGVTLTADGTLSGASSQAGSFPVRIRVSDAIGQNDERSFVQLVLLVKRFGRFRVKSTGTLAVPGRNSDRFILVENVGETAVGNPMVFERFDPLATFTLLEADPLPAAFGENSIFWELPSLAPGEATVLRATVKVNPSAPVGGTVTEEACAGQSSSDCRECWRQTQFDCEAAKMACSAAPGSATCIQLKNQCRAGEEDCRGRCSDQNSSCSNTTQPLQGAVDPNEKVVAARRFIQPGQLLLYPIHFENIGTIEARDVFVTDVLNPNLDASTLQVLTPQGASLDVATRTLRWDLLNRNLQPGETGNLLLSIRPRLDLPSGAVIRNQARIQFEVFAPLDTNIVENVIDGVLPAGTMNPLPAETNSPTFTISWSGSDAIGEIDHYTIFVSTDGEPFQPILEQTKNTSAPFTGEVGKSYGFLCIATDTAGNIEVQNVVAEAATRVVASAADLMITKTASPVPILTGSNITYTITITNNGPGAAANVMVTDNLPTSTTFVSCSSTGGGVCGGSGSNRTVTFTSLAAGASVTVTLVANVNCSLANGAAISNTATVSSSTSDLNPNNNSATSSVTISNPPPVITDTSVNPLVLWPPNHKMINVTVSYGVTDNCGPVTCVLSVSSNEPINGTGDGDTAPDWEIVDAHHVRLRAERAGNGAGRIYTITIICRDSAGNSSSKSVTVRAPISQGQN